MQVLVKPNESGSWINAIRNPSLRLGGMTTYEDIDGSLHAFIPSIHPGGYTPGDAYPVDRRVVEI